MKIILVQCSLECLVLMTYSSVCLGMTLGLRRVSCIHKPAQQHGSGCPSGRRDGPAGGQEGRAGESRGSGGRTEAGVGTALCGCSHEAGDRQDPRGLQLSGSRRWVQVRGAEGTIAGRGLAVPAPALSPPVPLHKPAEPQPCRQREGQLSPLQPNTGQVQARALQAPFRGREPCGC